MPSSSAVWARQQGLSSRVSPADILRAQIEAHRADVFYNLDATGWPRDLVKSLPGCVKRVIGWGALLLTDEGNYPEGLSNGHTVVTYGSPEHAVSQIKMLLRDPERLSRIAGAGHDMMSTRFQGRSMDSASRRW